MKRFTILVVIICFFISVIPVFTYSGKAYGETVFQKLSDDIAQMGEKRPEHRQTAWTSIFRKAKNNISTWDDTSAKSGSLRDNKAELMRRRGL